MSIYQEHGYENRLDYIRNQADFYGVEHETALMLADMLGPNEDFDGFVTSLEDYAAGYGF